MATPVGAFVHTPGTQQCWVHFRNAPSPYYLGTAVTAPEFEEMPRFIEIQNDLAGRSEPFQLLYDGRSALVSVTLNRLDLEVVNTIRDQGGRVGGFSAGSDDYIARGAVVLGRTDFAFIFANQYAGSSVTTPGLPTGRKYLACTLMGYKESAAGTRSMEVALVLRAWNLWLGQGRGFRCYSEDPNEFGTLIPN